MKKLTFLFALLCASMMGWAGSTTYCNETSPNANFTFSLMNISGNLYRIQFDAIGDDKFASTPYNNNCGVNQTEGAGITFGNDGWVMTDDRAYKDFSTATLTSVPTGFYGNYFCFNKKGGGLIIISDFNPSDVDWSATCGESCSDEEAPSVSAVSVGSITYNSAVLTITATDNTAVTRYVVKNGDSQIAQGTNNAITLTGLASGTTYNNIKVYAYDACNNESSAFAVSSFSTETLTYCRFATGHLGNAEYGDANGRILLTVRKISSSSVGVKVEPNNGGSDVLDYVQVILNSVGHDLGSVGGSDPTNVETVYEGLASLNFTLNVLWHHSKWADAAGRWTTNAFDVTEDQLCEESPIVLSEGSEYCEDALTCAHVGHESVHAYLSWQTTEDGDVKITISDGVGSTNATFRGNGFEGDLDDGFSVLSGEGFATSEAASKYFNRILPNNGTVFTLQRKGGAVLPSPAKIKFAGPAVAWKCTQDNDGYAWKTYEYTYGKTCAVVSGYSVSASANDAAMGVVTAKVGDEDVTHVDAGTTVRFTATANDTYTFVNWTKGGVVVSTNPVYDLEINEHTGLVANFDYIRNTYCHTAVTSSQGKKFYLTLGAIGGGQYQIKYEGSSEATITGINDANFQINGVSTSWDDDGVDVPFSKANDAWTFDNSGYGSVYTTFELADGKSWKDIYAWTHYMYFACEGMGEQTLTDVFPDRYRIAWNESCSDTEAPVLATPSALALNTTDVRLTLSATDNWGGTITYNVNYKPTGDAGDGVTITPAPQGISGQEITVDVEGLTTNTEYTFTVTASDGTYVSAAQSCTITPVGDAEAPVITDFTATPSYGYVDLAITATDDMGNNLTFTITYGEENVEVEGAPGAEVTKRIYALPNTDYSFSVVATDAASHTSGASVVETTTLTIPAAPTPVHNAQLVYSIYSDAYTPVVAQDFWRSNYGSPAPLAETDYLLYRMTSNTIVWGNDGELGSIHPTDAAYTDGEHFGLDVTNMTYLHFDVWCDASDQLNTVNLNNNGVDIATTRTIAGEWVSFDVPVAGYEQADKQNLRFFKFHPFNSTNCLAAIDNVYFYNLPTEISFGDDATDNSTTITANADKIADVTINRNISADCTWYTLCLPFDMDADKVSEVFGASTIATLVSSEERGSLIHLNFNYVSAIEAGKPYLIKPGTSFVSGSTISNVQIKNVNPSAEGYKAEAEHMHFQGTFDKIMLTGEDKRYVSANNELYSPNPNDGSKIGAFRCFFTIPEGSSALAPGRVAKIVFGEQTATGIDQMGVDAKSNGKLLINGVLYIIRDGKTYNAQGILIQ